MASKPLQNPKQRNQSNNRKPILRDAEKLPIDYIEYILNKAYNINSKSLKVPEEVKDLLRYVAYRKIICEVKAYGNTYIGLLNPSKIAYRQPNKKEKEIVFTIFLRPIFSKEKEYYKVGDIEMIRVLPEEILAKITRDGRVPSYVSEEIIRKTKRDDEDE